MRKEDLSIGYEIWAKPEMGIKECTTRAYNWNTLPDGFIQFNRQLWDHVDAYSLVGKIKAYYISRLAQNALQLQGDFVEFGCFRGGLSFMLGLMIQQAGAAKHVYMHDNFDKGLPAPDRKYDKAYVAGTMACPINDVHQAIAHLGLESHCLTKPGLFTETLGDYSEDQRFALVHIDCDLYQGAKETLEFVYPRTSSGAPVILDDYYDESHGVMIAMNEFAEAHEIVIHLSTPCQAYWIKDERPDETNASQVNIDGNTVWMTTDTVREDPGLLNFMDLLLADRRDRIERLQNFISFCRG